MFKKRVIKTSDVILTIGGGIGERTQMDYNNLNNQKLEQLNREIGELESALIKQEKVIRALLDYFNIKVRPEMIPDPAYPLPEPKMTEVFKVYKNKK